MSSPEEVLEILKKNARHSAEDIARQTDSDPAEIAAIIEQLEDEGVVRGYRAVIDWTKRDAEPVRAAVELNVELDRDTDYDVVAERIARFPMVESLHLVSGEFDFLMEVEGETMRDVSQFVSDKVAPVPGITQTVTHFVMDSYKEQGITFDDGGDDDRLSVSP